MQCNKFTGFEFSKVSEEVVSKILLSPDTSKAAGLVEIPTKLFERVCKSIGSSFEEYNQFIDEILFSPRKV